MIEIKIKAVSGIIQNGFLDHLTGIIYIKGNDPGDGNHVSTVQNLVSNQFIILIDEIPEDSPHILNFNDMI